MIQFCQTFIEITMLAFLRIIARPIVRFYHWIVYQFSKQDETPIPSPVTTRNYNEEQRNNAHPMARLHNTRTYGNEGDIEICEAPERVRRIPRRQRCDPDEVEYDDSGYTKCGF